MTEQALALVDIDLIDPNPWQLRGEEDPGHVREVADSIAALRDDLPTTKGLLQVPVARPMGDRFQLAFGNTRLASFQLLADQAPHDDWLTMPLRTLEIEDRSMFIMGTRENLDRQDLNPIEKARAVEIAREEFGMTSEEIAHELGIADSTARNLARLLKLPKRIQDQVAAGTLAIRTALKLLAVERVSPQAADKVLDQIEDGGDWSTQAVAVEIKNALNTTTSVTLWGTYNTGEGVPAKAGDQLWPLDWTPDRTRRVSADLMVKAFPQDKKPVAQFIDTIFQNLEEMGHEAAASMMGAQVPAQMVDQVELLRNPPTCTACPMYSAIDGVHYCGVVECWKWKKARWIDHEVAAYSEEHGIAIFKESEDGGFWPAFHWDWGAHWETGEYGRHEGPFADWLEAGDEHLRVRGREVKHTNHDFTKSRLVQLGSCKPEILELLAKKDEEKQAEQEAQRMEREADEELEATMERNTELSDAFLALVAAKAFRQIMDPIKSLGFLEDLARVTLWDEDFGALQFEISEDKKGARAKWKEAIVYRALYPTTWDIRHEGVEYIAEHLQGVARTWGVELPEDWLSQAEEFGKEYYEDSGDQVLEESE